MKELLTEWCSQCSSEVTIMWNLEEDGYTCYCPYCSKKLIFCSECEMCWKEGNCDWYKGRCSKYNPRKGNDYDSRGVKKYLTEDENNYEQEDDSERE